MSSSIVLPTTFAHYSTRLGDDVDARVKVVDLEDGIARIHFAIYRIPSTREFVLRNYASATAADRTVAERTLNAMPAGNWALYDPTLWTKYRRRDGSYGWRIALGEFVSDPLVQLELEMMIDNSMPASPAAIDAR